MKYIGASLTGSSLPCRVIRLGCRVADGSGVPAECKPLRLISIDNVRSCAYKVLTLGELCSSYGNKN